MKGLTIFEVLISVLIFSVIALGLSSAVVAGKNALFVSDIPTQLRQNVLFSIMSMARELRQTAPDKTNLDIEESSNSITFYIPRYNASTGVKDWGNWIKYERNGSGQLTRTSGGTTVVVAPNIVTPNGSPLFSRVDIKNGLIKIDVIAQKADGRGALYQDREQAIVRMRN